MKFQMKYLEPNFILLPQEYCKINNIFILQIIFFSGLEFI